MNSQSPYLKIKNANDGKRSSPTKDDSGCEDDFEEHRPMDPDRTPNFKDINTAKKMNKPFDSHHGPGSPFSKFVLDSKTV